MKLLRREISLDAGAARKKGMFKPDPPAEHSFFYCQKPSQTTLLLVYENEIELVNYQELEKM
ncbi:hypothetical protein ACFSO0_02345 [Brevibacillus sp. GCM10020057]|uniref:hypothetical protein n=1 Tax=Brevibacillus sp. GCM10020057 TaxID=3317327 RepID=UPI003633BA54